MEKGWYQIVRVISGKAIKTNLTAFNGTMVRIPYIRASGKHYEFLTTTGSVILKEKVTHQMYHQKQLKRIINDGIIWINSLYAKQFSLLEKLQNCLPLRRDSLRCFWHLELNKVPRLFTFVFYFVLNCIWKLWIFCKINVYLAN